MQHSGHPLSLAVMALCAFGAAMTCGCVQHSSKSNPRNVSSSLSKINGSQSDSTTKSAPSSGSSSSESAPAVVSTADKDDKGNHSRGGAAPEDFEKDIQPLVAGIAKANAVVVYEGLPHPPWDSDDVDAMELKEKKTVKFYDFPFYAGPIALKEDDAKKLSSLCSEIKTFGQHEGLELWYYPDWSIEFKDGDEVYQVLICLSGTEKSGQARLFGPMNQVWADLDEETSEKFVAVLAPLQKNRPVWMPDTDEKRVREYFGDPPEHFDRQIKQLVTGIAKANGVVVYEGLPHQLVERDLLAKELKEKKTIKLHDYPFYEVPITLKEEDVKQLSSLCSERKTFGRYGGAKMCGGFHPDWCIEFKDVDNAYQVLICFGCGEARLYGPKNQILSDLNKEASNNLFAVLAPLQKNRPKREPRK